MVDVSERLVLRDGEVVPLTLKAFDLLLVLLENRGRVVAKDDLMKRVWPDSFVEDANLSHHIYKLREALSDGGNGQKCIETLPRRGYRFVAPVTERPDTAKEPAASNAPVIEAPPDGDIGVDFEQKSRSRRALAAGVIIAVALLGLAAYGWFGREEGIEPGTMVQSMAVLPFRPLVAGQGDVALELGITDTLISKLSSIRQILVRPTISILKYGTAHEDPRKAGAELGVDVLLDGRVQKAGDRIRVSVQLIRTVDGSTMWASTFDEAFKDMFALQDSISERVATALALKLSEDEKEGLSKRYTDSLEAYQLYVTGRYHWSTFKPSELLTSINYYQEALTKDPDFALAYAGIAYAYSVIALWGPLPPKEAMAESAVAARRAVQLDDGLSEAHVALGGAMMVNDWNWKGAEAEFARAMALSPNSSDPLNLFAYYLHASGRSQEAVVILRRAVALAPQWQILADDLLWALFVARRYDEAAEQCRVAIKLNPTYYYAHMVLGEIETQQGRFEEGIAHLEESLKLADASDPTPLGELGYTLALAGKRGEAVAVIERLKQHHSPWAPFLIAEIFAGLGDTDHAFAWLNRAYDAHLSFLWYARALPQFDSIRSDPRYNTFLQRLNLIP